MPLLEDCFSIFESWGFTYRTCGFVWVKINKKSEGIFFTKDDYHNILKSNYNY